MTYTSLIAQIGGVNKSWKARGKMAKIPSLNAPPEYYELWKFSIEDPEGFWEKMAQDSMGDIYWFNRWKKVFERRYPYFKWFVGGMTNTGYNCLDYKL